MKSEKLDCLMFATKFSLPKEDANGSLRWPAAAGLKWSIYQRRVEALCVSPRKPGVRWIALSVRLVNKDLTVI